MMKQYKLEVAARAATMLEEHMRFLAQSNLASAAKIKREILTSMATLVSMPERHPFIDEVGELNNRYRKFFTAKRYLILYQIKDDTVYIDYIIDCRQDPTWLHL